MSEEIVKVLDYIGDKLGIAIDWSAENVWPYVMDILGRYRMMELIGNAIWFVILLAMIITLISVVIKSVRGACITHDSLWYDNESYLRGPSTFSLIVWIIGGVGFIFVLPFIIMISCELLKWAMVPEIKYLDMLQSYIK